MYSFAPNAKSNLESDLSRSYLLDVCAWVVMASFLRISHVALASPLHPDRPAQEIGELVKRPHREGRGGLNSKTGAS